MKEIIQYAREVMAKYPHLKEQIVDLHQLMKDEIADGASRDNELQLFRSSVEDLEKEQANITESSKTPQMRTERSFQLTDEGKNLLAYMEDGATDFIKQLAAFPDFDINHPFTDTYFYEIGDNSDLDMLLHSGYIEVVGGEEDLDEATWQKAYQDNFVVNQAPEETQAKLSFLSKNFLRIPTFIRGDFDLDTTEDLKDLSKTELWNAYTLTKKELEKQGALTEALEKLVGKTIKLKESQKESYLKEKDSMELTEAKKTSNKAIIQALEFCEIPTTANNVAKIREWLENEGSAYEEHDLDDLIGLIDARTEDFPDEPEEIDEAIKVSLDTLGKKPSEIMKAAQKADITITENKKNTMKKEAMIKSLTETIERKTGKKVTFVEAKDKEEKTPTVEKQVPESKNPQEPTLGNIVPPSVIKEIDVFVTNTLAEIDKSTSELRAVKKNITSGATATDEDFKAKTERISFLLTQLSRISLFCSNTIKAGKFDKGLLFKIIELKG